MTPGFTIVTPSFRMLDGLRLCAASIADQGVKVQHVIQDSCSEGIEGERLHLETLAKTHPKYHPELHVEKDSGIYQAVNRGFSKARHDILAYLNCDEQYLPSALERVAEFFMRHPEVDAVFGDALIVDPPGRCLCYRQMTPPRQAIIYVSHLPTLTCATFVRRQVMEQVPFREDLRAISDAYWVLDLIERGFKLAVLNEPVSVFTQSGTNFSLSPSAQSELAQMRKEAPVWMRAGAGWIKLAHRLEKLIRGCYRRRSVDYALYRPGSSVRTIYRTDSAPAQWQSVASQVALSS